MYFNNAKVDVVFALSEEHHFDDETFQRGRSDITAGLSTPTCRNCTGGNCDNNLVPDLLQQGLLTSGYHGGTFDRTSRQEPVGGISKDDVGSSHGSLYHKAADLAVNATMELLENIKVAVGDKNFLRYGPPTPETSRASGGQATEVTKSSLSLVTAVIEESSVSAVVVKNPGRPDNFTFTVDGSLRNITAYVIGASSLTFNLPSSTGVDIANFLLKPSSE
ncbi:hypothetical protein FQN60_012179, partial [Etheostoma spectabile]